MVVNTAGTDPHDFGGVDLVRELLDRARPDGSFPHVPGGLPGVNDTIFAIFALAPVEEAAAQAAIQPAADWIETAQHANGGWSWSATSTRDEVDMTGAAIQALVAAGRTGSAAVQDGIAYLRAAQNPDGGFPEFPGNPESNVASTAWAVQAIWAVRDNPEAWRTGSGLPTEEPLDYMESLQEPDGHIRWKRSQDLNGVWMTAYTTPAFSGHHWPIPFVPLAVEPPPSVQQPGPSQDDAGAGGSVIAGGGGRGAPLFSRPKPQSRGRTPGGARVIGDGGARPTNHSESRRGDDARQPAGISEREPSAAEASALAPSVVGTTEAGSGTTGDGNGSPASPDRDPGGRGSEGGGEEAGDEVTGLVVGSRGDPFFGAPGLRGEPADDGDGLWTALGTGAAALLAGLLGAWVERRSPKPFLGAPVTDAPVAPVPGVPA